MTFDLVMELGSFLAPLWWLWYFVVYIYSHSWALAVSIAAVSTAYLAYRQRLGNSAYAQAVSRPKVARVVTKHATLVHEVQQVMPVHPHNGWSLGSVEHGLRVFSRFFPSLGVSDSPCLAAATIIDVSPKKLLYLATNCRDIPCWLAGITMPPQYVQQPRGTHRNDADIITLTLQKPDPHMTVLERWSTGLRQQATAFAQKYATFLDGFITLPTKFCSETFEREWQIDGEGCGYVCWVVRQPSHLPYHWSMLVFSPSVREKGISIASLIMLPKSPNSRPLTSDLLTSQLLSLRNFACLRRAKAYSSLSSSPTPPTHLPPTGPVTSLQSHTTRNSTVPSVPPILEKQQQQQQKSRNTGKESSVPVQPGTKPVGKVSKPVKQDFRPLVPNSSISTTASFLLPNSSHPASSCMQEHHSSSSSSISTTHTPSPLSPLTSNSPSALSPLTTNTPSPLSSLTVRSPSPPNSPRAMLEARYAKLGQEACEKLFLTSSATEEDGWTAVGTSKGVAIMKKSPKRGEASVNCIKGTGIIKAPPEFVYRMLRNPENHTIIDDMLKETRVIDHITDCSVLVHLIYKAVWPTAPRDFTLISTAGRYDDTTIIQAGVSVVDPRLPEEKGYVRGNVVGSGYVVKVCPGESEQCEVTYVSQAELKGSIPTFAVNKVTESQPQCISRLRAFAEKRYEEMKGDPQKMKELEETLPLNLIRPVSPSPPPALQPVPESESEPQDCTDGGGEAVVSGEASDRAVFEGATEEEVVREGMGEGVERNNISEGNGQEFYQNSTSLRNMVVGGPLKPHKEDEDKEALEHTESWTMLTGPPPESVVMETGGGSGGGGGRDGMLVMEPLETYTPDEITSDEGEGEEQGEGEGDRQNMENGETGSDEGTARGERHTEEDMEQIRFEKKLPTYSITTVPSTANTESLTEESISYPRQESGGVDFRTLGNQTAARVLEELFHVSSLDVTNPRDFENQESGWKFHDVEKEVVILKKKTPGNPFQSFMGKGVIELTPRKVYDSIRNPQLRFTYDNMLKELHMVKHIEDGLYVLHVHHETTQCFVKQSRDFCILANERTEGDKLLLVGTSVDIPECPVNPNIIRGKITYSGWVVQPHKMKGKTCTEITYLLQVDLGGIPAALVNHISKRQPLAIAYLRDYLTSTSLQTSSRESSPF